jgi:hypothetical protein
MTCECTCHILVPARKGYEIVELGLSGHEWKIFRTPVLAWRIEAEHAHPIGVRVNTHPCLIYGPDNVYRSERGDVLEWFDVHMHGDEDADAALVKLLLRLRKEQRK